MPPILSRARAAALLAVLALSACATEPGATRSDYRDMLARLRAVGFAREEVRPADAPYGAEELARNFARAVHAHERQKEPKDPAPLQRWEGPVRYRFYGASPAGAEKARMAQLVPRLAGATGLDIAPARTDDEANLAIFVLNAEERRFWRSKPEDERTPYNVSRLTRSLADNDSMLCVLTTFYAREGDPDVIVAGATVILAELPEAIRTACIDEEVTQILGPFWDHNSARPSIFNDDQEFMFLTDHDEDLLRLLYDPRLSPGMMREDTAPILPQIIQDRRLGRPGLAG
ncbi:MAG: DUF2927 domain-containing protein [Pseudomonadota bacterium]